MKLKNELPNTIKKFNLFNRENLESHINKVFESGKYNDMLTRISWDMFKSCYTNEEINKIYDEYECNDTHIDTLVKRAFKESVNIDLTKYSK